MPVKPVPLLDRLPRATYRLQLRQGLDLDQAAELVPYLAGLGVSHLYLSPIFQAVPGSTHGYDVTRPAEIEPALGGRAAFDRLADRLDAGGLGLVLDIVPNHMAAHWTNPWWADVLARGPESRYADYFDISWERAEGRVVLPFLGRPLSEILERGELEVVKAGGSEGPAAGAYLRYHDNRFPLADTIDDSGETDLRELLENQHYRLVHFRDTERINYRRFFDISGLVSLRIEEPEVFAAVHRLPLELIWRGAVQGLRVDHVDGLRDPEAYLLRLQEHSGRAAAGALRGTPEAATRPTGGRSLPFYIVVEKILERDEELPAGWPVSGTTGYEFLNAVNALLVEPAGLRAIDLLYRETTGDRRDFDEVLYESKREVLNTLFRAEVEALVELIRQVPGVEAAGPALEGDLLREALVELTACLPVYRTYVTNNAGGGDRELIAAAAACVQRRKSSRSGESVAFLRRLFSLSLPSRPNDPPPEALEAVTRWQQLSGPAMAKGLEDTAFYRHHRFVALNEVGGYSEQPEDAVAHFHARMAAQARDWPGTLNATSTHDTKRSEEARARLAVLSEMPDRWSALVRDWEQRFGFNRSAGGRAVPTPAGAGAGTPKAGPSPVPPAAVAPADRLLLYQSAFAIWGTPPEEIEERLSRFVIKALREGKERSGWLNPDEQYEGSVVELVKQLLAEEAFRRDMDRLLADTATAAALNSLSQTLLKLTAPGIPDVYQGLELREFKLVDPDNRTAVDFERRARLLDGPHGGSGHGRVEPGEWTTEELLSGRAKLWLIRRGLELRAEHAQLFARGDYLPVPAQGPRAAHLVAFIRRLGSSQLLVVAPRFNLAYLEPPPNPGGSTAEDRPRALSTAQGFWAGTSLTLPPPGPGRWRDLLTAKELDLDAEPALSELPQPPLALLLRSS